MTSPHVSLAAHAATAIEAVANVGVVHVRRRYITSWSALLDDFKATIGGVDVLRGWEIMPGNPPADSEIDTFGLNPSVTHVIPLVIRGICSVRDRPDDEEFSQDDFLEVAWNVKRALDAAQDFTFEDWYLLPRPCSWQSWDMRKFGDTACWVAEMRRPLVFNEPNFTLEV